VNLHRGGDARMAEDHLRVTWRHASSVPLPGGSRAQEQQDHADNPNAGRSRGQLPPKFPR
jgi:hypothetical protein